MRRLAWLLVAPALACTHAPAPATPAPRPMPRATVERLLAQGGPTGQWRTVEGDALSPLAAIAADPGEAEATRAAALAALGWVENAHAPEVLAAHADDLHESVALRIAALRALALRVGRAGASRFERALGDRNVEIRLAAARALGTLGGAEARRELSDRLDAETDLTVREALQQSLSLAQP